MPKNKKMAIEDLAIMMQEKFASLRSEIVDIKKVTTIDIPEMRKDINWLKENLSPFLTKLDKYIKLYEDQKQEFALLNATVNDLKSRIAKLEAEKRGIA